MPETTEPRNSSEATEIVRFPLYMPRWLREYLENEAAYEGDTLTRYITRYLHRLAKAKRNGANSVPIE